MSDVNPDDKAKRYSDSQYMSFYSNNVPGVAAKTVSSQAKLTLGSNQPKWGLNSNGYSLKDDKENMCPSHATIQVTESNFIRDDERQHNRPPSKETKNVNLLFGAPLGQFGLSQGA